MKKFKFFVLDDESNPHGWKRPFTNLLKAKNYLRSTEKILANNSHLHPIDWQVVGTVYGSVETRFCKGLDYFREHVAEFDFYFFDLKMGDPFNSDMSDDHYEKHAEMILTNQSGQYKKNRDDESPDPEREEVVSYLVRNDFMEKIPVDFAGIEYLLITPQDEKPKFIYSAADETDFFRAILRLFLPRLADIQILNFNKPNSINQMDEVLTRYLRSRQTTILNRQRATFRQKLIERVQREKDLDKADIPDDDEMGNTDNAGDCWSLQTLFPKQVNQILFPDTAEVKERARDFMLDVLIETNFKKLVWWSLFNHGNVDLDENESVNKAKRIPKFKAKVADLKYIDFHHSQIGEKARNSGYKKLSSFASCTDQAKHGKELDDHKLIPTETKIYDLRIEVAKLWKGFVEEYKLPQVIPMPDYSELARSTAHGKMPPPPPLSNSRDLVKYWAQWYGIYALDIAWMYRIACANQKYCMAMNCYFDVAYHDDRIEFFFIYDVPDTWSNNEQAVMEALTGIQKEAEIALQSSERKPQLQGFGVAEMINLTCKRYRGTLEFFSGIKQLVIDVHAGCMSKNMDKSQRYPFFKLTIDAVP